MDKEMTYTDDKGNKLYGYSQRNLDQLVFWIKFTGITLLLNLVFAIFVFWYIKHYRVLGYAVDVIRTSGCGI